MKGDNSLSKNYVEIRVYPLQYRQPRIKNINIYASSEMSGGLGGISAFTLGRLDILGYNHFDGLNPSNPVTLATTIDEPLWTYINDGGTVLLLICDELDLTNVTSKPKIHPSEGFLRQHGLLLGGDEFHHGGVTGSHFIRKVQGLFERIPFENPIGWPFYRAIPDTVLIGMKPENNSDILAGGHGSFLRSQPKDSWEKASVRSNRHYRSIPAWKRPAHYLDL